MFCCINFSIFVHLRENIYSFFPRIRIQLGLDADLDPDSHCIMFTEKHRYGILFCNFVSFKHHDPDDRREAERVTSGKRRLTCLPDLPQGAITACERSGGKEALDNSTQVNSPPHCTTMDMEECKTIHLTKTQILTVITSHVRMQNHNCEFK